jgi:hypothetical protein
MKQNKNDKKIFKKIMEVTGIIGDICENKNLEDDHDLSLAYMHLNKVLDILESQLNETEVSK